MRACSPLESPVVTGLTATFPGNADMTPDAIPTCIAGADRAGRASRSLAVGRDQGPHRRPPVGGDAALAPAEGKGLSALGTRKITGCRDRLGTMRQRRRRTPTSASSRCPEHRLATRLTSLVVADKTQAS